MCLAQIVWIAQVIVILVVIRVHAQFAAQPGDYTWLSAIIPARLLLLRMESSAAVIY